MENTKFRAWLKRNKEMTKPFLLKDIIWDCEGFTERCIDQMEIMQFTGLLDCSGKEIYESDIVKVNGWNGLNVVKYYKQWAGFGLDGSKWKTNYIRTPFFDNERIKVKYEIIGNIYQDKNLLNNL